jgi:hypothetical protein
MSDEIRAARVEVENTINEWMSNDVDAMTKTR